MNDLKRTIYLRMTEPPEKKSASFLYEKISNNERISDLVQEFKEKGSSVNFFERIISVETKEWTGKLRCSDESCKYRSFRVIETVRPNKIKYGNGTEH
jgi:hypothetical protein